jgi:23S rRNA (cytosine1962-C5)-methyltransferase
VSGLFLFEDDHVLVVNKPSGINTHKPDRYAPDGIHEWLVKRESRWAGLSILHRLDKDTSGAMLFGKSRRANQSLTQQFAGHKLVKEYLLLASARPPRAAFRTDSADAVTEFEFVRELGETFLLRARPVTGKTHQIRRHAAENGFPILGDRQYGGRPAPRLMLHAQKLTFEHPESGRQLTLEAPVPRAFDRVDALVAAGEFRALIFDEQTNAYRLISGAADGFADVIVDSYAGNLLVQWQTESAAQTGQQLFERLRSECQPGAIYEQLLTRSRRAPPRPALSKLCNNCNTDVSSPPGTKRLAVRENGLRFLVSFGAGLGAGLFLDQRENRRRLLRMELAGKSVLNCFAYTCAFSVAAAKAGATVTSVDLSKNSLDWGRENFRANNLDPAGHDFIFGDAFDWLKRFGKRGRQWDVVIIDPPTFATTKKGRVFRAARDYLELLRLAVAVVGPGGTLFCSTNQRTLPAERFEATLREAARRGGRLIEELQYETLPFDFRVASGERQYLKTLWAGLD